jgi:hypothetical protein
VHDGGDALDALGEGAWGGHFGDFSELEPSTAVFLHDELVQPLAFVEGTDGPAGVVASEQQLVDDVAC